jgi:multicomponent Na+:H+ antiporter subunit E
MTEPAPRTLRLARRRWAVQSAIVLAVLWLALDGLANPLPGLLLALVGAALGAWLAPGESYPWRPLRLLRFFAWFLRESLRGGVDVAARALHPRLPIAPCLVEYRIGLPPGMPRTVMMSVLSLLPGTLSADLGDDGRLTVHALAPEALEGVAELECRVAQLFSLEH